MNRYIVQYTLGDRCTYSCDVVAPIISHETVEKTKDTICLTIMELFERISKSGAMEYFYKCSIDYATTHGFDLSPKHIETFKKLGIPSNIRGDDWLMEQLVICGHNFYELCSNIGFNDIINGNAHLEYQIDICTVDQWFENNIE